MLLDLTKYAEKMLVDILQQYCEEVSKEIFNSGPISSIENIKLLNNYDWDLNL